MILSTPQMASGQACKRAAAAPAHCLPIVAAPRRRAASRAAAAAALPQRASNVAPLRATLAAEATTEHPVQFETTSLNAYLSRRHELVLAHFPTSLGVDDFISRVEVALSAHGFRGDNSIGARARAVGGTGVGAPDAPNCGRGAGSWL
ncbi:hypothetical protein MNEG_12455 [Monoraphidium neglectum]|uniref:Uncharacterized protein n=1 Tax=Monoraphidium neglectum TaxID=145388 RepID=A0A0D2M257_9CHLO|nr:hypothetical protein MNEG_12455 [Monoraphidium neglectum]KIY95506.1 hypothetical protein MNEG_12455 [Monoraphidium neglectum]|eukprot:XP_013894526.1 hypothetical protein MNEG_12455 [Monoraphidium neglectum]